MNITLRSSSQNSSSTGTAISVSEPAGAQVGDMIKVIVHGNGQTTIVDNNGATPYTEPVNDYQPNTTNGQTFSVFSRVKQAGDPATLNFTLGASGRWAIIAMAIYDADGGTIEDDVAPSTANATNTDDATSGTMTVPAINTGVNNAMHITTGGWDTSNIGTITTPAGYTLIQNANGGGEPLHASYKIIATAGSTGTTQIQNTEFGARIGLSFSVKASTVKSLGLLGVGK